MFSSSLLSIVGFLVILCPLVVVHEFGHYFFARVFGVKAEIFSVGFGKKIWSRQFGETELRVSIIPLGGYVKLLGEDREAPLPPEEARRALHRQAAWKRFFIFFGGPLFNFIYAALVFMVVLAIGEPQVANVIGRVVHGSPAAQAGFRSGDRILAVDGKSVTRSEEVLTIIGSHPGEKLHFRVLHEQAQNPVEIVATTTSDEGFSPYGETARVGEINGLLPAPRAGMVGISDPGSLAAKAGIHTGEVVTELNGVPLRNFEVFEEIYSQAAEGSDFKLTLESSERNQGKDKSTHTVGLRKVSGTLNMAQAWGLHSSELFVEKVVPNSPAAHAGVLPGDRVIAVGGQEVQSFFDLKEQVQKSGETLGKVDLKWEHEGKVLNAQVRPIATKGRDALLKRTVSYTVGIAPMLVMIEPEMMVERIFNPLTLVYKGTERMLLFSWRNLISIQKMFTGDVSVATLGGPIMIGKIAGESLAHGLISFLTTMAILSIGLGVLNVLPVPVLDGGHLLLLGIEMIRRKPLTMRTMEIIQSIGLSAILLLMVLVMKNDFFRLFP